MSPSFSIWSEFLPYSWVQGDLLFLSEQKISLLLAIPESKVGSDELKSLLKAAQNLQVDVGAWLLLDDKKGYWPNSHNVKEFSRLGHDFLDWLTLEKLPFPQIIVDLEPDLRWSAELKALAMKKSVFQLVKALKSRQDKDRFVWASKQYNTWVQEMNQRGAQVMAVTYPLVVEDLLEENTFLQELLHIPVTTVQWNKISLMTYRSAFQEVLATSLSSHFVKDYLSDACKLFDMPVCGALGVIGKIEKIEGHGGYTDPLDLKRDIQAARASGVQEIHVFSLDGMHNTLTPGDWLQAINSPFIEPDLPLRKDRWVRKGIRLTRSPWLWKIKQKDP